MIDPAADTDVAEQFWNERYAASDQIWSGEPNAVLVDLLAERTPGRVLDLGCGEGGDAIWLAERGWDVTAVDISQTALDRGAAAAVARDLANRITWLHTDLSRDLPGGPYDVVSAQFFQSPLDLPAGEILSRAATMVVSGGAVMIVSHAAPPSWAADSHSDHHFPSADEVLASLDLDQAAWTVDRCETVERTVTAPDGTPGTMYDAVVVVVRRG